MMRVESTISGTVSVILPCYNVAPYLDQCLESLVRQTWESLEIICINDGSTDGTSAVLHSWAARDRRIRVVDRENGGQASARNVGMDRLLANTSRLPTRMIMWNIPCMAV